MLGWGDDLCHFEVGTESDDEARDCRFLNVILIGRRGPMCFDMSLFKQNKEGSGLQSAVISGGVLKIRDPPSNGVVGRVVLETTK